MTNQPTTLTPKEVNEAVAAAFSSANGAQCIEVSPRHALLRGPIDESAGRPGGFVSGPTQFAVADAALWYLTFGVIDRIELMALTSDMNITYLRPASGKTLWARADLLSAGTRKIVGSVRVWCDDRFNKPCSVAKGTYVLPQ